MLFNAVTGLGVVPFTYSAEVFPTVNRGKKPKNVGAAASNYLFSEAGMSLAVFINLFGAGILSLFVPWLQDSLGALGLFELFAYVYPPMTAYAYYAN